MNDVLRVEPLLFPVEFSAHRTRVLVNDLDVVAAAYPADGYHGQPVAGAVPSSLLGPDGLVASPRPREVWLGGAGPADGLVVRVRLVGSEVVWDGWRMADYHDSSARPARRLGDFRFDAAAYASELARATARADRSWPARSVAEHLRAVLWRDGYGQDGGTWVHDYAAIRAPEDDPDVVVVGYRARDVDGPRRALPGTYSMTFPVDGTDPEDQARAIVHRLRHEDLKPLSTHQPRRPRR
ncbi:hypothetical protein ACFYOT_23150 [Saccharothrix saharensis]|uniref:hypothetical protein n=1 Tax=Saccharothrix saharensis TaxID=571190 RepID=UPI00367D3403